MGRKSRSKKNRAPKGTAQGRGTPSGAKRGSPSPPAAELPLWKKILFSLLAVVLFFGGVELLLALVGVEPVLYQDDPYVGFSSNVPHFILANGGPADGAEADGVVLETAANKLRLFNPQSFARQKAAGTVRIFCLGGSTTYGRPYGDATSFCGWLRELLPVADPSQKWEVINAGGISYASYRVALLMEELIRYQPDLFILYTGHNEFLEERTYGDLIATPRAVRGLGALASRTRLFTAGRQALDRWRQPAGSQTQAEAAATLDAEVRTLLDASVGPDAYERDDALQEKVLEHYRYSLARMVDMAGSVGARTVLVNPASNLRDCSPFKSQPTEGLATADQERWQALFDEAEEARAAGEWGGVLTALEAAAEVEDRHAGAHYLRGQALDALGRYEEARVSYERARDEDVCPLRALGPVRRIVAEVAEERRVPLVDFAGLVEGWSRQEIPGENLFLDHVHPTIEGHRRLALEILGVLVREGVARPQASWGDAAIQQVKERVESRLDPVAQGRALSNLSRVLGWAGKLEEGYKLALQAIELAPNLTAAHHQAALCAHLTERIDEAIVHYRRTIELDPSTATAHSNLAVILDEAGQDREAAVHYRRAIALLDDRNAAYRDSLKEALAKLDL